MTSERVPRTRRGLYVRPFFAWYDFWIGVYVDQKEPRIFVALVPCLILEIGR
jgi:hypothetical protein